MFWILKQWTPAFPTPSAPGLLLAVSFRNMADNSSTPQTEQAATGLQLSDSTTDSSTSQPLLPTAPCMSASPPTDVTEKSSSLSLTQAALSPDGAHTETSILSSLPPAETSMPTLPNRTQENNVSSARRDKHVIAARPCSSLQFIVAVNLCAKQSLIAPVSF